MKKKLKRAGAALVTLALCAGMMPAAFAVAEYETIAGWQFDESDTYSSAWSKGGYTSSGISPTISIEGGKLKVEEDYTGATSSTYNNVTAVYSFGSSNQADLSEATQIAFDYYCREGETPNRFLVVFTGTLSGATAATTKSENIIFDFEKTASSDISGYDKYEVIFPLTDATASQKAAVTRFQIGENRTNNTYVGTVYYDNIRFQKAAEAEQPSEPEGDKINTDSNDDIPAYTTPKTIPAASEIKSGGKFRVVHTNSAANVVLALTGTGDGYNWVNVSNKTSGTTDEGYTYLEFSYDALVTAWGSDDFSNYQSVRAQTWSGETIIISIEWIPAAEPEEKTAEAKKIPETTTDGSLGYYVEIIPDGTVNFANAKWRVTNDDSKTAEKEAATADTTTVTTEGGIIFGLVITADAIGNNTIGKVEFIY